MSTTFPSSSAGIASGLVLWWVRLYTTGLSSATRSRRLDQLQSDLWEHYADRSEQGASPALIELEALGRAARGILADLFWRFQLEEPQMQLNIPIERIGGACLLVLVAAAMLSLNVDGYDAGSEDLDGELRRLAGIKEWQTSIYSAFTLLSGLSMLAGAAVLYLMLKRYSTTAVALAAVSLAAAGLMTLVASAAYATAADLADEYVAATPDHRDAAMTVARASIVMMSSIVSIVGVTLSVGVFGFALIVSRERLVPSWLRFVAGGSALAFVLAFVMNLVDGEVAWACFMVGLLFILVWLLVTGGWLLLGRSRLPSGGSTGKPEEAAASGAIP